LGARRLDLGFFRVDGRVEHIRIGTARPSRDPLHLARLMLGKLDTVDPGLGVEDAILAAFAVDRLAPEQIEMTGDARAAGGDLGPLFDRLGARLGLDALARLEPRASHLPERTSVAVPISESGIPKPSPRPPLAGQGINHALAKPPRPVRLFETPEPIEAVMWVLPDDPPSRFTWRRRTHRVAQTDGPERIAEEWWRPDSRLIGDAGKAAWFSGAIRDYYRVEDETGRRFWLFRAGLPGDPPPRWFIHGVFA
jgi:protein ImuB